MDVHRAARIAAVAHGGQVLVSAATRALVDHAALQDLGRHRLKDLREPEHLFQLGTREFPALKTLYADNLPVQPNPLVGRDRDVQELARLVRDGVRLLTLTGPGGSGKTRVGLAAATELRGHFPGGVWFVPLAPVTDPALVEQTIAQVLGVRGDLREELRSRQLLLVLDNFEQLLDGASVVSQLLAEAPGLSTIVTTRERLAIAGEREWPVPTLGVEDAVALFAERASSLVPEFAVDEHVAEIARRLDGLPLAIELAAARIKVLSAAQIVERLGGSLDLLSGRSRDAPARHRTLRATLEWSHDLLAPDEAALFARLGVFAGGFDLAAAEAVADASLDDLAALVEKSMLRRGEETRFFLLETVRQFAVEQLEASGLGEVTRARHAEYHLALAERSDAGTRDGRQSETVATLLRQQPDLRLALDTLAGRQDPLPQARLVAALTYFWFLTGNYVEALGRLEDAYGRLGGLDVQERAAVANGLTMMLGISELAVTGAFATEALEASRRHGDVADELRALTGMSFAHSAARDWDGARRATEEQVALARSVGERWYEALGTVNLAVAKRETGQLAASRESALEALRLAAATGDPTLQAGCACNAAHAELLLEDFAAARTRFVDALKLVRSAALPEMVIWCLDGLAAVDARDGDAERAAQVFGAAEALAASTSYNHPGTELELRSTRLALEERLGREHAAALRAQGAALDLSAAIELALGEAHPDRMVAEVRGSVD